MATMEGALRAKLLASAGLASTIIHDATDKQATPRPKITYQRVTTSREFSNDGPLGIPSALVQVDCWADDLLTARNLADAVRLAIDGFRGTVGIIHFQGIHIEDESDEPTPLLDGQQKPIQRVRLSVRVHWKESI